jgi:hypothetical protein
MKLIRQLLASLRRRRPPRHARYGAEVLFAGWVELPEAFHRRPAGERGREGGRFLTARRV